MYDLSRSSRFSIRTSLIIIITDVFIAVDFEVKSGGINGTSGINSNMNCTGDSVAWLVVRLVGLNVNITAIHAGSRINVSHSFLI